MNASSCVSRFHFPEACRVGLRIAKTLFADNGPLTPTDRRTFKNEIEEAVCDFVLKPDNAYLNAWSDGEREYDCLAVIEIKLRKTEKAERIADLFHRTMPYPLLLVIRNEESRTNANERKTEYENQSLHPFAADGGFEVMFSMAEKRFSRDGRDRVVIERTVNAPRRRESELEAFFAEADYAKFRKTTFRDLNRHYMNLLEALCVEAVTGEFRIGGVDPEARRRGLEELHRLELKLAEIKARAKKEGELPAQVELNLQAGKTIREMQEIREKLRGNHER